VTTEPDGYIPTLDGMRAVAILMVIAGHALLESSSSHQYLGNVGVSIFFGLSGFLITSRLIREFEAKGRISLKSFYIKRVFRILPPAIFYLAVVSLLAHLGYFLCNGRAIRAALFFYLNYVDLGVMKWKVAHFWSLSVEEHFYLVWPALLIFFGVRKGWRTAGACAVAITLWRVVDERYHLLSHLLHDPYLSVDRFRTDLVGDALFWGCCLAFVLRKRLAIHPAVSTGLTVFSAFLFVLPSFFALNHIHVLMNLTPTLLLAGVVTAPQTLIGRFLELSVLKFIGRISYSLYIWQQLFFAGSGLRWPLVYALSATLACALVSYYAVERPCIALGRRLLKRARTSRGAATQPAQDTSEIVA
jgi:peptidoglycan/LPS O-acetylase OafA/YrhL